MNIASYLSNVQTNKNKNLEHMKTFEIGKTYYCELDFSGWVVVGRTDTTVKVKSPDYPQVWGKKIHTDACGNERFYVTGVAAVIPMIVYS